MLKNSKLTPRGNDITDPKDFQLKKTNKKGWGSEDLGHFEVKAQKLDSAKLLTYSIQLPSDAVNPAAGYGI